MAASAPVDCWHADTIRLRALWRLRSAETEGRVERGREALGLIDRALVFEPHPSLLALRVEASYAGIGDLDAALEWLEKGFDEHDLFMLFLGVDILFRRTVGDDPRYAELVDRLGLG